MLVPMTSSFFVFSDALWWEMRRIELLNSLLEGRCLPIELHPIFQSFDYGGLSDLVFLFFHV